MPSSPRKPRTSAKPKRGRKTAPSRGYHHGDLKAALLRSATELLRKQGPEALTLRGVARAAGVSQAAPYRHFADRRALVAAVAEEGFQKLHAEMLGTVRQPAGAAGAGGAGGASGFKQVGLAYVRFALANPAQYRIMFGPEVANKDDLPSLRQTARGTLGFVAQAIGQLQAAGVVRAGDAGLMAATIWSVLHGLVMLTLDGQTAGVAPQLDSLVEETMRVIMVGLAARPG